MSGGLRTAFLAMIAFLDILCFVIFDRLFSMRLFLLVSFMTMAVGLPLTTNAAVLSFSDATTLTLSGISFTTLRVAAGSAADALTVDSGTITVSVALGDTLTLESTANIALSNTADLPSTCGTPTRLVLSGPRTNVVITPMDSPCVAPRRVEAVTPPGAPASPTAVAGVRTVTLTWIDPVDSDLSSIVILRNSGGDTPVSGTAYAVVGKNVRTFTDTNVTADIPYRYIIRAQDAGGSMSVNANEIAATPRARPVPVPLLTPDERADTETSAPATEPVPSSAAPSVAAIVSEAVRLVTRTIADIASAVGAPRDFALEQQGMRIVDTVVGASSPLRDTALAFITYGTTATVQNGARQRGAAFDSYRLAYGKEPSSENDMADVLHIAVGRTPDTRHHEREQTVEAVFGDLYGRLPNRSNPEDDTAVLMLAYGLQRPTLRDLRLETIAIGLFGRIYGRLPATAADWNAVRAMTYSGAQR